MPAPVGGVAGGDPHGSRDLGLPHPDPRVVHRVLPESSRSLGEVGPWERRLADPPPQRGANFAIQMSPSLLPMARISPVTT
jgi:hypothetical protein